MQQVYYLVSPYLGGSPAKKDSARSGHRAVNHILNYRLTETTPEMNPEILETESETTAGTTGFYNEALSSRIVGYDSYKPSNYLADDISYESRAYFSRYRLVGTVENPVRHTWNIADWMNDPQFSQRFQGAMGIRGTFKIKITWSTDPMTQGLYLLCYIPPNFVMPGSTLMITAASWLPYFTGLPHVLLNVARDSSAELVVPYVGETPFMPLYDTRTYNHQCGKAVLIPVVDLKSGVSPVKVVFNTYFALDNAELHGTQPNVAHLQAAAAAGTAVVEALRKSKLISTAAGFLHGWINANEDSSPIRRAASWIVGGAGKIADMMGFSKPIDVKTVQQVCIQSYNDTVACDKTFTGVVLANNSDAGLSYLDLSGAGIDEMTIKHICSRYEYFKTFEMAKTDNREKILSTWTVTPQSFAVMEEVTTATHKYSYQVPTHPMYLSTLFGKWRGSFAFKVVPVCTRFHAARLRVVMSISGTANQAYTNMSYTHTAIINLDEPDTWEFTVPFMGMNPWRRTMNIPNFYENNVTVTIFVENALIAPDSVSPTISFAVFVKGGDDLEFAELGDSWPSLPETNLRWVPWMYNLQTSGSGSGKAVESAPVIDAAKVLPGIAKTQSGFSLAPSSPASVAAHSVAVGDPIRSIRACLKRFMYCWSSASQNMYAVVTPWLPRTGTDETAPPDLLSLIAPMYTFYRGGLRYFANNYYPVRASLVHWRAPNGPYANCTAEAAAWLNAYQNSMVTVHCCVNEPLKVEVPYYHDSQCINMWTSYNDGLDGDWNIKYGSTRLELGLFINHYLGNTGAHIQRAAADDFDLGFLVSAPPLLNITPVVPPSGKAAISGSAEDKRRTTAEKAVVELLSEEELKNTDLSVKL